MNRLDIRTLDVLDKHKTQSLLKFKKFNKDPWKICCENSHMLCSFNKIILEIKNITIFLKTLRKICQLKLISRSLFKMYKQTLSSSSPSHLTATFHFCFRSSSSSNICWANSHLKQDKLKRIFALNTSWDHGTIDAKNVNKKC